MTELGTYRRPHGTLLQVVTRRGRKVPIVCPRCRTATREPMFWHAQLEHRVCDTCWRQLEHDRLPAVLT